MIVDTSAVICILKGEADASLMARALQNAPSLRMSSATYLEAAIVTDGNQDPVLSRQLDDLLRDARILIEPVTEKHARIAREAYRDFGKGRHRAGLNFGDCFSYALARATGEPLLFKGKDFSHTDVKSALDARASGRLG